MSRSQRHRLQPAPLPTVFVVDDDEDMRDALGNLFRSVGHEVKLFGSAAEFLQDAVLRYAGLPGARRPPAGHERARLPGQAGAAPTPTSRSSS